MSVFLSVPLQCLVPLSFFSLLHHLPTSSAVLRDWGSSSDCLGSLVWEACLVQHHDLNGGDFCPLPVTNGGSCLLFGDLVVGQLGGQSVSNLQESAPEMQIGLANRPVWVNKT